MKKIFMLPIEPLDTRYSIQWKRWFFDAIAESKQCERLVVIDPEPLTTEIVNGAFLDVCGTNYYKSMQLAECCKLIHEGHVKDGDIFLLHDAWFPGVEMLAYMRDGLGINFKIAGCFHAGTYDPTDFISKKGMGRWGHDLENSWLILFDHLFVATEYHKQLIMENRCAYNKKLHVTGFPIEAPESLIPYSRARKIVVFPHRLTDDKQPWLFDELARILGEQHPEWEFIRTQDIPRTKQEYYDLLSISSIAVSFALHENWGIGMQEATILGCLPVVPDRLSYKEMYPSIFRYTGFDQALFKVDVMINAIDQKDCSMFTEDLYQTQCDFVNKGDNAIPNMLEVLNAD